MELVQFSALAGSGSAADLTGTKAQFNAAVTDGDLLFVGDVTQYTDEAAQDAVGAMGAQLTNVVQNTVPSLVTFNRIAQSTSTARLLNAKHLSIMGMPCSFMMLSH